MHASSCWNPKVAVSKEPITESKRKLFEILETAYAEVYEAGEVTKGMSIGGWF